MKKPELKNPEFQQRDDLIKEEKQHIKKTQNKNCIKLSCRSPTYQPFIKVAELIAKEFILPAEENMVSSMIS